MKTNKEKRFTPQKNQDGSDVYCPIDSEKKPSVDAVELNENCVEKDVVERYSGNIDIKTGP
jgi:hypothetical protein